MVQDPVNSRFFRIGWIDFEVLLRWGEGNPGAIVESVTAQTTLSIDESDVHASASAFGRVGTPCELDGGSLRGRGECRPRSRGRHVRAGGPLATVAAIGDSQRQERATKDAIHPVRIEVQGIPQGHQMMLASVCYRRELQRDLQQ